MLVEILRGLIVWVDEEEAEKHIPEVKQRVIDYFEARMPKKNCPIILDQEARFNCNSCSKTIHKKLCRDKIRNHALADYETYLPDAEEIKHICKEIVAWGTEHNEDTETMIDKQATAIAQRIGKIPPTKAT